MSSGSEGLVIGVPPEAGADGIVHTVLEAGERLGFEAAQWCGALVLVQSGALMVHCRSGRSAVFGAGCILHFSGLDLDSLSAAGAESVVLLVLRRSVARAAG